MSLCRRIERITRVIMTGISLFFSGSASWWNKSRSTLSTFCCYPNAWLVHSLNFRFWSLSGGHKNTKSRLLFAGHSGKISLAFTGTNNYVSCDHPQTVRLRVLFCNTKPLRQHFRFCQRLKVFVFSLQNLIFRNFPKCRPRLNDVEIV